MDFYRKLVKLLLIFCVGIIETEGYRILGVFPMNSKSHDGMFKPLVVGLAKRGHQVDVITHFEIKNPPKNYRTIINLSGTIPSFFNNMTIDDASNLGIDPLSFIAENFGNNLCELMSLEKMQKLIRYPPNDPPYDLVITEAFSASCYIGFGYVLNVPVITVSTLLEFPWISDAIGNPSSTAIAANTFMNSPFISTFFDRLKNTFSYYYVKYKFFMMTGTVQTEAMRKYLSPNIPDIREIERSVALMFVNSHYTLFGCRPTTPAVVGIAGLHAEQNDAKFPSELEQWMDNSKNGVVYFTLGSMVLIETLPKETLLAIYASFGKIAPVRVLMKIVNKEKLPPGLPKNVLVSSWIPQVPVLKHNNTRVFITHGGLMGTQEALYFGVPMIGLPIFTDQFLNVETHVKKNMAIRLDFKKITEKNLDEALTTILNNPEYKEAAKRESRLFRDRPMTIMDTVNFWTEYTIRNGPTVLRSPAIDLYWWQNGLLDVYAFLTLCCMIIIYSLIFIVKITVRILVNISNYSIISKKEN